MSITGQIFVLLGLALVLLAGPVASAEDEQGWTNVTVIMADGTRHENVTVSWALEGYQLALIAQDGTGIMLGPLNIASIQDASGSDITQAVADVCPADDVGFALLGDDRTVPFTFKVMLGAGGSGAMTTGDGSGSPVWAGFAGLRIGGVKRMHLHALYRRQQMAAAYGASGGQVTGASHEIHIMLGYRLKHPLENNNYAYLEAGLALMDYDQKISTAGGGEIPSAGWESGLTVQGGAVLPLSDSFAVDLGALFMVRPPLVEDGGSQGMLFGLNVGLTFR